jgi:hypothetical protein
MTDPVARPHGESCIGSRSSVEIHRVEDGLGADVSFWTFVFAAFESNETQTLDQHASFWKTAEGIS